MFIEKLDGGFLICGDCTDKDVIKTVVNITGRLPLIIADPPYGNIVDREWDLTDKSDKEFCQWMFWWSCLFQSMCMPNAALYVWGGIGKPNFRPFYRYLCDIENSSNWKLANHITWSKRRGYGTQNNYLFTREELAYLTLGETNKPRVFNVPLLDEKRGYAGFNAKYPAKSEYYRRTNVWSDINELLRGKVHINQKPEKLHEVIIETHTNKGEWVFDPFAGSGTTGRAARNTDRKFIIVEKNAEEFEICINAMRA